MANTIAANVSINLASKKVRYKIGCYILHTVFSVIILLLTVTIICYDYAKHRSKQKSMMHWQDKMENNKIFKKFVYKNRTCYYFDDN